MGAEPAPRSLSRSEVESGWAGLEPRDRRPGSAKPSPSRSPPTPRATPPPRPKRTDCRRRRRLCPRSMGPRLRLTRRGRPQWSSTPLAACRHRIRACPRGRRGASGWPQPERRHVRASAPSTRQRKHCRPLGRSGPAQAAGETGQRTEPWRKFTRCQRVLDSRHVNRPWLLRDRWPSRWREIYPLTVLQQRTGRATHRALRLALDQQPFARVVDHEPAVAQQVQAQDHARRVHEQLLAMPLDRHPVARCPVTVRCRSWLPATAAAGARQAMARTQAKRFIGDRTGRKRTPSLKRGAGPSMCRKPA